MRETREDETKTIREGFERACDALSLGREGRAAIVDGLLARFDEPRRHYHDARHMAACVSMAAAHRAHAPHPNEVVLALLFHDAIYDPQARDNEARSATLADDALSSLGAGDAIRARIVRLVMATAGHEAAGDADAELVLACDLAILGADEATFDAFERDIRAEYAFVPDDAYRAGRSRVLLSFLERATLYGVPAIAAEREDRARANLQAALSRLAP